MLSRLSELEVDNRDNVLRTLVYAKPKEGNKAISNFLRKFSESLSPATLGKAPESLLYLN